MRAARFIRGGVPLVFFGGGGREIEDSIFFLKKKTEVVHERGPRGFFSPQVFCFYSFSLGFCFFSFFFVALGIYCSYSSVAWGLGRQKRVRAKMQKMGKVL